MTVEELIKKLATCDFQATVRVHDNGFWPVLDLVDDDKKIVYLSGGRT